MMVSKTNVTITRLFNAIISYIISISKPCALPGILGSLVAGITGNSGTGITTVAAITGIARIATQSGVTTITGSTGTRIATVTGIPGTGIS